MTLRLTEEEFAALQARRRATSPTCCQPARPSGVTVPDGDPAALNGPPRNPSKYRSARVTVDGLKFDSRKEADYYFSTLLPLHRSGALKLLLRQAPFDLPGGIRYIADFVAVDQDGAVHVIDVKSEITRKNRVYINKRKQMQAVWNITIEEV